MNGVTSVGIGTDGRFRRRARSRARVVLVVDAVLVAAFITLVTASASFPLVLAYAAATVAIIQAQGGYRPRLRHELTSDVLPVAVAAVLPMIVMGPFIATDPGDASDLLRAVPFAPVVLLVGRGVVSALLRAIRKRDGLEPTLIVGAGTVGTALAEILHAEPGYGIEVVGIVDDLQPECPTPAPIVGNLSSLDDLIQELDVAHLIIAFGHAPSVDLIDAVRRCRHDVQIRYVPRLFEVDRWRTTEWIHGVPLVRLDRSVARVGAWHAKRLFDVVVSGTAIVVLAPLLAALAIAVRVTSRGPALFRQERIGQHGRHFELLKFRSMLENSDSSTTWSVRADDRVTPVGHVLRRTGLDELPQLFNVLRGDMSLVGPRPERPHFAEQFSASVPRYADRHRVPVGVTGLAQIHGLRGDTSIDERAWMDNQYIQNWSLWSDILILVRTPLALLRQPERASSSPDSKFLSPALRRSVPTDTVVDLTVFDQREEVAYAPEAIRT